MLRWPSLISGALVGGLTSLPVMALMYLGQRLAGLPFVPFDLFNWLARVLPGLVVAAGIDAIVTLIGALHLGATDTAAKRIEQSIADFATCVRTSNVETRIKTDRSGALARFAIRVRTYNNKPIVES